MANKKFNVSAVSKIFEANVEKYTKGFLASTGFVDRRRKNPNKITKVEIKRAKKAFLSPAESVWETTEYTSREAALHIGRTKFFNTNYVEEVGISNIQSALKKFGYRVQKRSIQYNSVNNTYYVKGGKYKGSYVKIVRDPSQEDSLRIDLVPFGNI